jgi:hypothetical protein
MPFPREHSLIEYAQSLRSRSDPSEPGIGGRGVFHSSLCAELLTEWNAPVDTRS